MIFHFKWFLDKTGHEGLNNLLAAYEDKTAYAQCIFAFTEGPEYEPRVFVGKTDGRIVPARGPLNFGLVVGPLCVNISDYSYLVL